MILKEAFRHQNYLDRMINLGICYLSAHSNVTQKECEHLRTKAYSEATDEKIVTPKTTVFENKDIMPNDIVSFVYDLIEEKNKLTLAISKTKRELDLDIDSSIAMNKVRQEFANVLGRMGEIKSSETVTTGRGTKFDAEGKQTTYVYDIKEVVTIDFDRNRVKKLAQKLIQLSDEISTKKDVYDVTATVDYTVKYNLTDSFEDCVLIYKNNK